MSKCQDVLGVVVVSTVLFFSQVAYAGIAEVYWDPITASNGEEVYLYARMSDSSHDGQNVEFEIYEYDLPPLKAL